MLRVCNNNTWGLCFKLPRSRWRFFTVLFCSIVGTTMLALCFEGWQIKLFILRFFLLLFVFKVVYYFGCYCNSHPWICLLLFALLQFHDSMHCRNNAECDFTCAPTANCIIHSRFCSTADCNIDLVVRCIFKLDIGQLSYWCGKSVVIVVCKPKQKQYQQQQLRPISKQTLEDSNITNSILGIFNCKKKVTKKQPI